MKKNGTLACMHERNRKTFLQQHASSYRVTWFKLRLVTRGGGSRDLIVRSVVGSQNQIRKRANCTPFARHWQLTEMLKTGRCQRRVQTPATCSRFTPRA